MHFGDFFLESDQFLLHLFVVTEVVLPELYELAILPGQFIRLVLQLRNSLEYLVLFNFEGADLHGLVHSSSTTNYFSDSASILAATVLFFS